MKTRMSQLPLLSKCRAAAMESAKVVNSGNDFTASGRAWHRVAENYIKGKANNAEIIAAEFGVDLDDAIEAIDKLSFVADFDASKIEKGTLMVWDYKSGFGEVEHPARNMQLMAYALGAMNYLKCDLPLVDEEDRLEPNGFRAEERVWLLDGAEGHPDLFAWHLDDHHDIKRVELIIIYPRRDGWTEKAVFDNATISLWAGALHRVIEESKKDSPDYRVGEHCARCDGRLTCPAVNKQIGEILVTGQLAVGGFSKLDPLDKGLFFSRAKAVAEYAKDIMELAKSEVDAGREVRFSDGTVLAKVIKSRDRNIESAYDIWPLVDELPQESFDSIVSVSVGPLEAAYKDHHGAKTDSGRLKKGEPERLKKEFNERAAALGMQWKDKFQYRAMLPAEIEKKEEVLNHGEQRISNIVVA